MSKAAASYMDRLSHLPFPVLQTLRALYTTPCRFHSLMAGAAMQGACSSEMIVFPHLERPVIFSTLSCSHTLARRRNSRREQFGMQGYFYVQRGDSGNTTADSQINGSPVAWMLCDTSKVDICATSCSHYMLISRLLHQAVEQMLQNDHSLSFTCMFKKS